jgi:hypothetical protein
MVSSAQEQPDEQVRTRSRSPVRSTSVDPAEDRTRRLRVQRSFHGDMGGEAGPSSSTQETPTRFDLQDQQAVPDKSSWWAPIVHTALAHIRDQMPAGGRMRPLRLESACAGTWAEHWIAKASLLSAAAAGCTRSCQVGVRMPRAKSPGVASRF